MLIIPPPVWRAKARICLQLCQPGLPVITAAESTVQRAQSDLFDKMQSWLGTLVLAHASTEELLEAELARHGAGLNLSDEDVALLKTTVELATEAADAKVAKHLQDPDPTHVGFRVIVPYRRHALWNAPPMKDFRIPITAKGAPIAKEKLRDMFGASPSAAVVGEAITRNQLLGNWDAKQRPVEHDKNPVR